MQENSCSTVWVTIKNDSSDWILPVSVLYRNSRAVTDCRLNGLFWLFRLDKCHLMAFFLWLFIFSHWVMSPKFLWAQCFTLPHVTNAAEIKWFCKNRRLVTSSLRATDAAGLWYDWSCLARHDGSLFLPGRLLVVLIRPLATRADLFSY